MPCLLNHLSSLTLDRFFSEQLPVYQELLSSEKEPKPEFSVKTVDEYLIKIQWILGLVTYYAGIISGKML